MTEAADMIRLRAPAGTDEANVGTQRFRVHDDGTITVPHDVAVILESGAAGFVDSDPAPPPEIEGTLRLRGAPGASATWHGVTYSVDQNGIVSIPAAAWSDLSSHGFKIAPGA